MTAFARGAPMTVFLAAVAAAAGAQDGDAPPAGFVRLDTAVPGLVLDVRYHGADNFVGAAADPSDTRTKAEYYPDVPKSELFARGYVAEASGHSRGSTVDLTVVRLSDGAELDMGTPFDFFGPESAADHAGLTAGQRANRRLLADAMRAHGFETYPAEWWHFTLADEPYPDTWFDFPVR